jgi:hypothetical protein
MTTPSGSTPISLSSPAEVEPLYSERSIPDKMQTNDNLGLSSIQKCEIADDTRIAVLFAGKYCSGRGEWLACGRYLNLGWFPKMSTPTHLRRGAATEVGTVQTAWALALGNKQ